MHPNFIHIHPFPLPYHVSKQRFKTAKHVKSRYIMTAKHFLISLSTFIFKKKAIFARQKVCKQENN